MHGASATTAHMGITAGGRWLDLPGRDCDWLGLDAARQVVYTGCVNGCELCKRHLSHQVPGDSLVGDLSSRWVFGRHLIRFATGQSTVSGRNVLWMCRIVSLGIFAVVRGYSGYGDMFLHRSDNSWQQWLHVSKYPPSLTYYSLELGILFSCLALLRTLELRIGTRENGPFYVFGQTAMFFYIVHRLVLEVPATYFGLRDIDDMRATYGVSVVMLILLYPACRWYRTVKAAHPHSILKYL